jgi:hypothetical protein
MTMRRGLRGVLVLAGAMLALAGVGCTAPPIVDRTLSMRSGEEIWVRSWARCDGLKPELSLAVPPAHGTVDFRPIQVPVDHTTWECMDDSVSGVGEFYTPAPGFSGEDQFTVTNWWGANFRFPTHDTARILVVTGDATPWPAGQATMHATPSTSAIAAELPADVRIAPPDPDVPPALAALSGTWSGAMCPGSAASVKVAVEQVTPVSGSIIYAVANSSANMPPKSSRIDAVVKPGDELRGKFGNADIVLRSREDGRADIFWSNAGNWCSGVLTRTQETFAPRSGS